MIEVKLFYADVIEIDDSTHPDGRQLSRIKVRIQPSFKDVKEDLLPWATPFLVDGMATNQYSHEPPEIGSKVWVFNLDEFYKHFYYIKGNFINNLFVYSDIESLISNIEEITPEEYPNLRFKYLPDGSVMFYGKNGNIGIYHVTGSYVVISEAGDIVTHSIASITIKATTDVIIQGDASVTLLTDDSAAWRPNILEYDPFTGLPHGGTPAGIIKLKGS